VRVSDTGSGVSENVRATMFQPFVTGNKNHGSGLGLAVTKAIVLDHGGGIVVESQRDLGSTFTTFLPLRLLAQPPKWNSILSIPPTTAQ
jgi:signal transduction histidine kinase